MRYRLKVQWWRLAIFAPAALLSFTAAEARADLSPELQKCSNVLNQVVFEAVRIGMAAERGDVAGKDQHRGKMEGHVSELVRLCFRNLEPRAFVGEGIVKGGALMFGGECDPEIGSGVHPKDLYDYALDAAMDDGLQKCIQAGFSKDQCEYQGADDGTVIGPDPDEHRFGPASQRCRVRAYFKARQ